MIAPPFFRLALAALGVAAALAVSAAENGNGGDADSDTGEGNGNALLPLEKEAPAEARRLSFETDAVTWMSLDVSPDGETILFDVLGDLYAVGAQGGRATRITEGMAFDSQPIWSPDGRHIAFISDRSGSENLWIADADGANARKLSTGGSRIEFASPAWAPDGSHIVVSRTSWGLRSFELWAYHIDGGSGVRITRAKPEDDTPQANRPNALGAVYAPDGEHIYYGRRYGGFAYNQRLPIWQLVRREIETGTEDTLTRAQGSAFRPQLSPDGELLAYATRVDGRTGLRVRNLETGVDTWLAYPVERDEQESRFTRDVLPGYDFTPDGKSVVFSRDGRMHRVAIADGSVQPIPFTLQVEQTLGPDLHAPYRIAQGDSVRARLIQNPALSPDGRRVAFSAFARLYVHDLESGATRQATDGATPAFHPAWSPNGRDLAFVSWNSVGGPDAWGGHIWRIRATGRGTPERLTEHAAFYSSPAYAPDGRFIVALRSATHERIEREHDFGEPAGSDLIRLPAGGGRAEVVTPSRGLTAPHFGPEADRVYLYSVRDRGGIVSMRFDGSDRRALLRSRGHGIYNAEDKVRSAAMRISPTGRMALVLHTHQLYVVKLVNPHLSNLEIDLTSPALPVARLTDVGADSFGWNADGSRIYWSAGDRFFSRDLASVEFKPKGPGAVGETLAEDHEAVVETTIGVSLPRQRPNGAFALVGARILPMTADGAAIENGIVVVEGDRIRAVGGAGTPIPEGAERFDVSGKTILPGYVNTHAHFRPMRQVMDTSNWSFLANLAYGVTTGLDVQPSTVDILAYEDMIDAGIVTGPRALSTGPGIFNDNQFASREHARAVLTRYRDRYRVRNLKSYLAGSREQRHWIAQAARDLGMMPTTEGGLDMKLDITHAIDGFVGNEHNFPLMDLRRDVVELVARSGMDYTPTLLVTFGGPYAENWFYTRESPRDDAKLARFTPPNMLAARLDRRPWVHEREHVFSQVAAQALKIIEAGGRVGVGGHGQLQGLGYHWELWALASGGLTNMQALRAATRHGAEIIGIAEDVGTIEPGKLADLVVLDGNPLEDLRATQALHWVVKGGEVFDAETLDRRWPARGKLPDQWWWHVTPQQGAR